MTEIKGLNQMSENQIIMIITTNKTKSPEEIFRLVETALSKRQVKFAGKFLQSASDMTRDALNNHPDQLAVIVDKIMVFEASLN